MDIKLPNFAHNVIMAVVVFLAMILPRIFELDKFVFAEEPVWLMNSANFYYALGQRDLSHTFQSPGTSGITTMWIETVAIMVEYPEYRGYGQGYFDVYANFDEYIQSKGIDPLVILRTSRIISVLLFSVLISLSFLIIKRLVGTYAALTGALLIAFEPWYLALSRFSHTDALQASFQFISTIAFIRYYTYRKDLSMLVLSGLMGGLAYLSKFPGLISAGFVVFIVIYKLIATWIREKPRPADWRFQIKESLKIISIWILSMLIAVVAFWPYTWVRPMEYLGNLYGNIASFSTQSTHHSSLTIFATSLDIEPVSKLSFLYLSRYLRGYVWQTTPVVLLGLLAAAISYWKKWGVFKQEAVRSTAVGLVWFVAIFTVTMTIPARSSARYFLAAHLPLALISGLGLTGLCQEMVNKTKVVHNEWGFSGLLAIFITWHMTGTLATFPYYSSYYNPLLGGASRAGEEYFVGIGEGLNEAAEYLNAKPDAQNLTVMTWFPHGSFSYYFDGKVVPFIFRENTNPSMPLSVLENVDYLVYYNNLRYRPGHKVFMDHFVNVEPEHEIWINGIEYARIYKVTDLEEALESK